MRSEPPPRFLADAMLGTLARWLRTLGLDVLYDAALDDSEIVGLARREGRTILTRDSRLILRRDAADHVFVRSEAVEEQIRQVLDEKGLEIDRDDIMGRCLRCNEPLIELSAATAAARVPPYVARTQKRFRLCPCCDRVYWPATHVDRMLERLRDLGVI